MGLRFYYWTYYKDKEQLGIDEQVISSTNNYNNHSGYAVKNLFILPQYGSFKEEISFYKYLTVKQYKKEITTKINKYINANIVKKTKAIHPGYNPYVKHYGIKRKDPLKREHVLSIVLYCDYSDLCSDFSRSFRKISRYEQLENIKKRNRKYYYLSKYLREVVEAYGQCLKGDRYHDRSNKFINKLTGPFYSGVSVLLNVPEFNIRLCSPTSTSMQIEVAIKFSGEEGIILQFNNSNWQCRYLRCFNVSWLSRYKEEDERFVLFSYFYCFCCFKHIKIYLDFFVVVFIQFK